MEFNLAQKRIINARANGIKLIKGEVSCGKTVSAIKRAFKLQQLYCVNKDDDILILAKDSHHLKALESIHESILSPLFYPILVDIMKITKQIIQLQILRCAEKL